MLVRKLRIGDTEIEVDSTAKPGSQFLFVNLHDDENTGVQAGLKVLEKWGGRLVELRHSGHRDVSFRLEGTEYRVDPNRIFTPSGVRATLLSRSRYSPSAAATVSQFAAGLLELYGVERAEAVIALHNNSPEKYSAQSYAAGGEFSRDAEDVSIRAGSDPDDFFFVTERVVFDALKARGYNTVLQDNRQVSDDGSLSVYCGKSNVRYINVEAEAGHLTEQTRMISDLLGVLRELGPLRRR